MAAGALTPRRRGLAPVLDAGTRVLILGSFPGTASLAARQYYAHPRNHFWPLMEAILGEALRSLPYDDRLARLKARGIGLWDTIVACRRDGSLDAAIRDAAAAEPARLRRDAPNVQVVCFNGATAARATRTFAAAGYATVALPSTSPAHARPVAEKLGAWRVIGSYLGIPACAIS
ncbi:MAG: DNA-deoxyinosine glycosylase [Burkholderiales bacterium]